jgi:hypothetical protein
MTKYFLSVHPRCLLCSSIKRMRPASRGFIISRVLTGADQRCIFIVFRLAGLLSLVGKLFIGACYKY